MGFIDGIKRVFVGEEEEDEEMTPIYDNDDDADVVSRDRRNREVKIAATTTLQIVLARPTDYSEVKSIGDDLNDQKTVLLNLETVKPEDAKRILDFLSGVAYANGADIKMMAQKTFAIMPRNVGFSGVDLMSELESNGYSF
ncbi:MAG: cell division protein SepF [Oscillospiraceae bacterium]|nr:cell division protein SepF [Oscillospiraceae bacterium]MBQ8377746.1 cell division protein SepF [Oscillospiraceae bacterium]MBQ8884708.1 cell division protein SepF [Oscillospiraceae bacterium]